MPPINFSLNKDPAQIVSTLDVEGTKQQPSKSAIRVKVPVEKKPADQQNAPKATSEEARSIREVEEEKEEKPEIPKFETNGVELGIMEEEW